MKPAYAIVREARALIQKGWIKGQFEDGESFCAVGALNKAARNQGVDTHGKFMNGIRDNFAPLIRAKGFQSLPGFNDNALTSKKDVVNMFTQVMRKLR